MLDFSWTELLLVAVLAVLVIGPKEMPQIMYKLGKFVQRLQYMKHALSNQFDDFMMQTELRDNVEPSRTELQADEMLPNAYQENHSLSQEADDNDPDAQEDEALVEQELSFLKDLRASQKPIEPRRRDDDDSDGGLF